MHNESVSHAGLPGIRYGQVWEDADVLLEALDVRPGDVCVSIASAGDNVLALLTRHPSRVIAVDRNPAQLACLELRIAAYRTLTHSELLELIGSRPSQRRTALYARCRSMLSASARTMWDARPEAIAAGIGGAGKLERYFSLFRQYVLPLVHGRDTVAALLRPLPEDVRGRFYSQRWDSVRWRLVFRTFFSRAVMARLGRDRECFRYADGPVAERILERARHALAELDPSANPYLHWIVTGTHGLVLPCALRAENFDIIRSNLDRLTLRSGSVESLLEGAGDRTVDRFNLSDMFEYVSPGHYHRSLREIVRISRPGARLVYWNLLAMRRRPEALADRVVPLDALAARLHDADRAFFYRALRIEEVQ